MVESEIVTYGGFSVPDFTVYFADSVAVRTKNRFSELVRRSEDPQFPEGAHFKKILNRMVGFKVLDPGVEDLCHISLPVDTGIVQTYTLSLDRELNIGDVISITEEDIKRVMTLAN